jgi:hypothetical protein
MPLNVVLLSDLGGEPAVMYSLIVKAKMNDIDPQACLADVLARIANHPVQRIDLAHVQRAGKSGRLTLGRISYAFTIRLPEICRQSGGSASEISCASLASAKTSSRITRMVT